MKRFLSLMIAVIMVLSMVPTSFATELDGIVIANQGEVIFLDDEADTTDVQAGEEPEEISEVPAETEVVFEELTEMDATFEEVPVDDLVIAEPEEVVEEETPAGDASAEEPADDAVTGEIPAEGETAEGEAESGLQDVAMQLMLTAATDEEMVEALSEGTSVATYDELVAALANGGTITLTADIITVDTAITVPDGTIIDLNGKTLYVNVENSYYNNVTIKNGNIVLGKDDVHVCDGYFLVNEGKTLVLNDVNMSSSAEGIKGYAVFHLNTGANLDLVSSELNISNNEYAGYIVYAGENTATVDITSSTITGSNVNGIVHAATIIDSSTVTLTPVVEHGINRSAVTINDSAVTISGGTGRGITAQHGALMISGDSTVKITDMSEATIQLRNNNGLTINESATVVLDKDVEQYTENGTPSSGEITGTVTIATADIMIGETGYETLDAAIAAANGMTGDVTVEIYGKVEYSSATADLTGAYASISFVGKTEDAEISITRDGSNGYISGQGNDCTVNFSNLILSKPTGTYASDAGFMNVYFTVYRVGAVNYTNCTFPDGACAQGCPVTYTTCEFANQTSGEYSLWVYANTTTTVTDCEFTGVRGAKMYGEGASKTGNLVMKNTTFTKSVTEKPAIVLTYGQSVTLDGNTYPVKGVFELDADGDPDGTTVTADAEEIAEITCINDNGACGVLVNDKIYTTVAQAAAVATSGDTVTLLHNSTETVELAEGVTLNKNGYTADNVTVATPAVSGTITGCLVDLTDPAETFIASEITGLNATESVVIKLYSGETQIATTTLLKTEYYVMDRLGVKIIITGDSSSWKTEWAEGMPRADVVPDKVVLYVDGQEMNSANVPMTSTNGELAVDWADVPGVNPAGPTEVATYDALVAALAEGKDVKLTANIICPDQACLNIANQVLDLNGHTLTLNGESGSVTNAEIKNGTIAITTYEGDTVADGVFDVNGDTVINNVDFTSNNCAIYALFDLKSGNLTMNGGSIKINNNTIGGDGGVFFTNGSGTLALNNVTVDCTDVGDFIANGAAVLTGCTISLKGTVENGLDNGINGAALTLNNTTLTVDGATGRGITTDGDEIAINGTSAVTLTNCAEGGIRYKASAAITVADTASLSGTVKVDSTATEAKINDTTIAVTGEELPTATVANGVVTVKYAPTGTITPAYTDTTGFWGEGESNASESYVVELYEGETKIASASLNDVNNIIDGVYKNVTWSIPFAGSTDEYWTVDWAEGYPKYDMNPDTVKLVVDGTEVATNNVRFNNPDDLKKIVALAEGFTGGVVAYTSLAEAMGSFNGRQVNVLRDVAEDIEEFSGVTLTTNVEGGVTITNTLDDYIYTMDATIGEGVTVVTSAIFFQGGENTIIGRVEVDNDQFNSGAIYYQGYDAIVNVKDGGSVDVEGSVIFRYNEDGGALNIYGDGDDSTVEFACDYYIGAYSGTFYAEDANIETGYFLLKNSYDESNYADVSMTLNNSSLTVAGTTDGQDSFIIDDQASLTLKNGASIEDVRDFSILAGADLELNIDETSSISATNVSIAEDVCWEAEQNADGTWAFTKTLEGTGTEEDPYLIKNLEDLILFRDSVNTYTSDGSNQYKGKYVKLTADIDLEGINWTPIGTNTVGDHEAFLGTFDGDGHTISNLYINADGDHLGFFARVGSYGEDVTPTVKNITFNNVDVSSNTTTGHGGSYVGGVIANAGGNSVVSNVKVTGDVYVVGYGYVGGIVGHGYPDITDCHVAANDDSYVNAHYWCAGGIIGYAGEGGTPITNCSVSGLKIWSGYGGAAAVAGLLQDGNTMTNVSATNVEVTSASDYCMGYVAGNGEASTMTNVTATNVTATANGVEITSTDAVAKIGNAVYFDLDEAFNAAADGDEVKILAAGTYALSTSGKNITITGAVDGVVFDNIGAKNMGGADVTFNNVTFDYYPNVDYTGLQHSGNLAYSNCTINGQVFLYGERETFTNCTFNQNSADAYNVWTYGAKEVEFTGCTFNCAGKSVLVYNEGACATKLTVTDCDFIANNAVEGKAAIEIDTSSPNKPGAMDDTKIIIDADTTAKGFGTGSVSGNSLWNDKKDLTNLEVWVADKKVWPVALPTATVTEIENEDLTFAMNFKADEVTDAQLAYYGSWYADFVLTVNKDVTFNADGTADGYLSGQYDAWSENWVNVPFEDVTLNAGESIKIMEYAASLTGQSGLKLTYNDVYTSVKDFDCGVFFDNEFLAANPGLEVTLELRMYNPADETESYVIGDTYTFNGPAADIAYGGYVGTSGESDTESYRENMQVDLYNVNARESLVVELWSGETKLSTTTLRQTDRDDETVTLYPATGSITANIVIFGRLAGSWDTEWHVIPSVDNIPDTIKAYADGVLVDTWNGGFTNDAEKAEYIAMSGVAKAASITDADGNVTYYGSLAEAIAAVGAGAVTIELLDNCSLDYNAREAYGTAETTSLTIKGNGHTLTLNQKDSDWSSIGLANASAKLVLSDMTIEKTGYGDTSGAWNTHAINFTCNVEMNSVTVNNSMSVENGATLNNVTINEANGYYGLWIVGNGQTVTVTGGAINATNGGRGIKIAEEYVDAPKQVILTVTDTAFNTANKAAVLVSSAAGAKVTASGVDISNVAADTVNFVWNDEDYAAYYNSVKVYEECTKAQENEEAFPIKVWYVNGDGVQSSVRAYYMTLDELFAAPATQVPGSNYIDLRSNVETANQVNVHYGTNRVYTFGTSVEGGVTMTFEYADNWNLLPKFDLGENITMHVPYLQVIGGDIEIAGTLNTGYLYLYGTGEGVTITETGVVKADTSDATVQVKGGTVLTVNGELTTGTLNVWTEDTNDSKLIVSGENAKVIASHIHAWDGQDGGSAQEIVVKDGATLTATNLEADRSATVTVDAATLTADSFTLGYGSNYGTLKVLNGGVITNGVVLNSIGSTVTGPEDLNVTTTLDGYKVVYENGVHKVAVKTFVAQIVETQYMTLAEAFKAAEAGETITLLDDTAEVVTIENGASVILDLNGKTLTGSIQAPDATLTVQNGSIVNNDPNVSAIEINAGTLVLENVNIESERHAVRIDGKESEVTATIKGGIYKVLVNYERTSHAVNVSGNANVTINGGIFYGPKGTLNGSAMGGSAVNVQLGSTVTITGGNFSGGVNDTLASVGTLSVTGGIFDQDPTAYCAEGYVAVDNEDGTWTVAKAPAVTFEVLHNLNLLDLVQIGYWIKGTPNNDDVEIANYGILVWDEDAYNAETDHTVNSATAYKPELTLRSGYMQGYGKGVYAQYLDTVFYAIPYVVTTDGEYIYSDEVDVYTIPTYATQITTEHVAWNVTRDLLNYATYAQYYFFNRNDGVDISTLTPINNVLPEADRVSRFDESMLVNGIDADKATAGDLDSEWKFTTANLEEAIALNYFSAQNDSIAGMLYWNEDTYEAAEILEYGTQTEVLSVSDRTLYGQNTTTAKIENIYAKDISAWQYASMYSGTEGNYTYNTVRVDSIAAYLTRLINATDASANDSNNYLVNMCQRMLAYGVSAKAYAEK